METKTFKAYPIEYDDELVTLRIFPEDVDHTQLTEEEISKLSKEVCINVGELFHHKIITKNDLMVYERCYEIPLLMTVEVMEGHYYLHYYVKESDLTDLINSLASFIKTGFEFNFSKTTGTNVPTIILIVVWNNVVSKNKEELMSYLESIKLPKNDVDAEIEFIFPTKIEKVKRTSNYPFGIVGFDINCENENFKMEDLAEFNDPSNNNEELES